MLLVLLKLMLPGIKMPSTRILSRLAKSLRSWPLPRKKAVGVVMLALLCMSAVNGLTPLSLVFLTTYHWQYGIITGIAALIILDLYGKRKEWEKVVYGVGVVLFIVLPIWAKLNGPQRTVCPRAGWQVQSCLVTAAGTEYFVAESDIPSGPHICYDPYQLVASERNVTNERSYFRFVQRHPDPNVRLTVRYKVVDGPCPLVL